MATPDYNCTQDELYTILNLALNNLQQNLTDFSNFKARYTLLEIGNVRTALAAARQMPDEQARTADAEIKRIYPVARVLTRHISSVISIQFLLWEISWIIAEISRSETRIEMMESFYPVARVLTRHISF